MIEKIIRPKLGRLRLSSIGTKDIANLHSKLKKTPFRANRVLALLSKIFTLVEQWGWMAGNPARGIPRFSEDRRERWLTDEEIRRFSDALDDYSDQNAANALRLILLTGARAGEVLTSDWSQFDLKRGVWDEAESSYKAEED